MLLFENIDFIKILEKGTVADESNKTDLTPDENDMSEDTHSDREIGQNIIYEGRLLSSINYFLKLLLQNYIHSKII